MLFFVLLVHKPVPLNSNTESDEGTDIDCRIPATSIILILGNEIGHGIDSDNILADNLKLSTSTGDGGETCKARSNYLLQVIAI